MKQLDLTGQVFGRLTAYEREGLRGSISYWRCICKCGNKTTVSISNLTGGTTTSCGCYARDLRIKRQSTHGLTKTPEYKLFNSARTRAKREELNFNLDISDIIIPEYCPILKIPLFKGVGKPVHNSPTLDKINNELGYIKGNIRVISYRANTMKSNCTIEILENIIKYIKGEI